MISVEEASRIVLSNLYKPGTVSTPLSEAEGHVLAEPVLADRDAPPFDRVTMDGIAILEETWRLGRRSFKIEDIQAAGHEQKELRQKDQAIEVMTGAVLPKGTDAVIRYEDLDIKEGVATVKTENIARFQSVHRRGQDARQHQILIHRGTKLSAAEIAVAASVGAASLKIFAFPSAAIVSCGDELVDVSDKPKLHQIRRSNSYALEAAMKQLHWKGTQRHFPDDKTVLKKSMEQVLEENDVVIISGGVSAGKFDFIPTVLQEIGVRKLFHQVSQRPGKPFWFGVSEAGKTVFALPGNPVSTFMCFYRYIKPWLMESLGCNTSSGQAILASDFTFQPALTYFLQVMVKNESGKLVAYPDTGGGSGDFINLNKVTGFLELPLDKTSFKAGEAFPYIPFRL